MKVFVMQFASQIENSTFFLSTVLSLIITPKAKNATPSYKSCLDALSNVKHCYCTNVLPEKID